MRLVLASRIHRGVFGCEPAINEWIVWREPNEHNTLWRHVSRIWLVAASREFSDQRCGGTVSVIDADNVIPEFGTQICDDQLNDLSTTINVYKTS